MQTNSLVVCVDDSNLPTVAYILGLNIPEENQIYRVRGLAENGGILLDEIQNETIKFKNGSYEPSFHSSRFIEVLEPVETSELLQELDFSTIEILEFEMIDHGF